MIGRITVAASAVAAAQAFTCTVPSNSVLYDVKDGTHEERQSTDAVPEVSCANGAKLTDQTPAKFTMCTEAGQNYVLEGCEVDDDFECKAPTSEPNGSKYLLTGDKPLKPLKISGLVASAFKCPKGQESNGTIVVKNCDSADGEYELTGGCKEIETAPAKCELPGNAEHFQTKNGKKLNTLDLKKSLIDPLTKESFKCVSTKTTKTGEDIVFQTCAQDGAEFILKGCDTDVEEKCKAPTADSAYANLVDLKKDDQETVKCASTHTGTPKVDFTGCTKDSAYKVSGCDLKLECKAPKDATMYAFNGIALFGNETHAEAFFAEDKKLNVTCAPNHQNSTAVTITNTVCTADEPKFKLAGCKKTPTSFKPQPSSAFTAAATGAVLRTAVVVMSAVMYLKM